MSNNFDKQYLDLLKDILENGQKKSDRTGTGTLSVFGRQIRHKMSDGFPAVTTKKLHFKGVVSELLWFLNGRTDLRYLLEHNNFIWVGDAYKKYMKTINEIIEGYKSGDMLGSQPHIENMFSDADNLIPLSEKEFIEKIKSNDEFDKEFGDLGKIYGHQWRNWTYLTREQKEDIDGIDELICGADMFDSYRYYRTFDQITNLINDLKTNPDSRRLMVNAWNVGELGQMTLPPCHYGFQVYTRELSLEERIRMYALKEGQTYEEFVTNWNTDEQWLEDLSDTNIPTIAISLMWNQRSQDVPLGGPYNWASYGLLLEIIAKTVNMVPDELIINIGDAHIYLNQIDGVNEQLGRELSFEERRDLMVKYTQDNNLLPIPYMIPFGEESKNKYLEVCDKYKIPKRTRESYPLPTLKHMKTDEFYKSLGEDLSLLSHLTVDDFVLENYKSHPKIYFPLSN
jgi:thymidylate synthase